MLPCITPSSDPASMRARARQTGASARELKLARAAAERHEGADDLQRQSAAAARLALPTRPCGKPKYSLPRRAPVLAARLQPRRTDVRRLCFFLCFLNSKMPTKKKRRRTENAHHADGHAHHAHIFSSDLVCALHIASKSRAWVVNKFVLAHVFLWSFRSGPIIASSKSI